MGHGSEDSPREEGEIKRRRVQEVREQVQADISEVYETNDDEEEEWQEEEEHADQRTGETLDPKLVKSARQEEIQFMENRLV